MPLATPLALSTAMSLSTHSMLVLDRIEAVSRLPKPMANRPSPISRTAWPTCCQVQLRQMPRSFWRSQTFGPRRSTACQNMAGMVSPGSTTSVRGWMLERSHR